MSTNELSKSPNFLNCYLSSGPIVASFLSEICEPDEDTFIPFDYTYRLYELWLTTKKQPSYHLMSDNRFSYIVNNIKSIIPAHCVATGERLFANIPGIKIAFKTTQRIRVITGFRFRSTPALLLGEDQFEIPDEKTIGAFVMQQTQKLAHVLAIYRRKNKERRAKDSAPMIPGASIASMYKNAYIEEVQHLFKTEQITPEEAKIILARIESGEHLTAILQDMEEKQAQSQNSGATSESAPSVSVDQPEEQGVEYREDDAQEDKTDQDLIDNTAT